MQREQRDFQRVFVVLEARVKKQASYWADCGFDMALQFEINREKVTTKN